MGPRRRVPTREMTKVRSEAAALKIIYAAILKMLPPVESHLNSEEKKNIRTGDVFVWEERGKADLAGTRMERWTDGKKWNGSQTYGVFLYYRQSASRSTTTTGAGGNANAVVGPGGEADPLIKQAYSVFLASDGESVVPKKWHLTAYYSEGTYDTLCEIDSDPQINSLVVPEGFFEVKSKSNAAPSTSNPYSGRNARVQAVNEWFPSSGSGKPTPKPPPIDESYPLPRFVESKHRLNGEHVVQTWYGLPTEVAPAPSPSDERPPTPSPQPEPEPLPSISPTVPDIDEPPLLPPHTGYPSRNVRTLEDVRALDQFRIDHPDDARQALATSFHRMRPTLDDLSR